MAATRWSYVPGPAGYETWLPSLDAGGLELVDARAPRRCRGKSPFRVAAADRDAGSVLLEIPPGAWEWWVRRQNRRMLGSVYLRDDSAGTLASRTRCGLYVDADHDFYDGPATAADRVDRQRAFAARRRGVVGGGR